MTSVKDDVTEIVVDDNFLTDCFSTAAASMICFKNYIYLIRDPKVQFRIRMLQYDINSYDKN